MAILFRALLNNLLTLSPLSSYFLLDKFYYDPHFPDEDRESEEVKGLAQ